MEWGVVLKGSWTVFWITTLYSYASCGLIGVRTGMKTNYNREAIDAEIEKFIISPFYVATFFTLFAVLLFWQVEHVMQVVEGNTFINGLAVGLTVFVAHTILEVGESTFVRHDPLRVLKDHDALKLGGIYLLIILLTVVIASYAHSHPF